MRYLAFFLTFRGVSQIAHALGISGVIYKAGGWSYQSSDGTAGAQVDIVLERNDHCTNLIEIKFSDSPYIITKEYEEKLRWKKECYRKVSKTRNSIFLTMISPFGVVENAQYFAAVDNQIRMDALFLSD